MSRTDSVDIVRRPSQLPCHHRHKSLPERVRPRRRSKAGPELPTACQPLRQSKVLMLQLLTRATARRRAAGCSRRLHPAQGRPAVAAGVRGGRGDGGLKKKTRFCAPHCKSTDPIGTESMKGCLAETCGRRERSNRCGRLSSYGVNPVSGHVSPCGVNLVSGRT